MSIIYYFLLNLYLYYGSFVQKLILLRLFDATVTPTVLYSSGSWTVTKDMLISLRRAHRRMLRLEIGSPRRITHTTQNETISETSTDDVASNTSNKSNLEQLVTLSDCELLEPWQDFIRRATREVEATTAKLDIDDWTTTYLRRKWRWAKRVANQTS